MNRRLLIGAGIVLVLLIALVAVLATGGDDDTPSDAAVTTTASTTTSTTTTAAPPTTTTTVAPSTTTTTAPTSTTSTTGDPALPDTSGDDFDKIFRELIAYHNWTRMNPMLADAAVYLDSRCDCFEPNAERIAELAANGWMEIDEGVVVVDVDVQIESANRVQLRVIDEHTPLVIVDAAGEVVEQRDARGPTLNSVTLSRTEIGWLIREWDVIGPVENGG